MAYNVTATPTAINETIEPSTTENADDLATDKDEVPETIVTTIPEPSQPPIKTAKPRLYRILYQTWHRWISILLIDDPDQHRDSDRPVAYLRTSVWDGTKLDLHETCDKTSPVIAHCKPSFWTSRIRISLGDHNGPPEALQHTELVRQSFTRMERTISIVLDGSPTLRTFTWRRTHRVGICGRPLESWSTKNFKLMDEEDNVVAVFNRPGSSWHTEAKLEVTPDLGNTFEHMVWMSIIGYYAMVRAREASHGGGGGGAAAAC